MVASAAYLPKTETSHRRALLLVLSPSVLTLAMALLCNRFAGLYMAASFPLVIAAAKAFLSLRRAVFAMSVAAVLFSSAIFQLGDRLWLKSKRYLSG